MFLLKKINKFIFHNKIQMLLTTKLKNKSIFMFNSLILLAKRNYKSKDGTIKQGILINKKWYAPKNDC